MLRAPIWIRSTFSLNTSRYCGDMSSVTIGRPTSSFTAQRMSSPSSPSPWKEYGLVLGLKAPPRRRLAPDSLAAFATSSTCSKDSTEQGPAISPRCPPPIFTPDTSITESSGWNARLASLYGSWTCMTLSTLLSTSNRRGSIRVVSPIQPMIVISVPRTTCVSSPRLFTRFSTRDIFSSVVWGFNTIIIFFSPPVFVN